VLLENTANSIMKRKYNNENKSMNISVHDIGGKWKIG
jgi:hypothetical protein